MTENELLKLVEDNGWERVQYRKVDGSDVLADGKALEHWVIGAIKTDGDVTTRKNFLFYKWADGSCTWQEKDPFSAGPSKDPFIAEVSAYLEASDLALVRAGGVDSAKEVATATAIDGAIEKQFVVRRKEDGNLEHIALTRTIEAVR